jgi:hypothetical protein
MQADGLLDGIQGLAALATLARDLREGLLAGAFWSGFLAGAVALLALRWVFSKRCDRCDDRS